MCFQSRKEEYIYCQFWGTPRPYPAGTRKYFPGGKVVVVTWIYISAPQYTSLLFIEIICLSLKGAWKWIWLQNCLENSRKVTYSASELITWYGDRLILFAWTPNRMYVVGRENWLLYVFPKRFLCLMLLSDIKYTQLPGLQHVTKLEGW